MMNDPALAMMPFDSIGLYEQPKPRFIFKMPRVVPDQKNKFESDELFKKLARDSEVSFVSFSSFLRRLSVHLLTLPLAGYDWMTNSWKSCTGYFQLNDV